MKTETTMKTTLSGKLTYEQLRRALYLEDKIKECKDCFAHNIPSSDRTRLISLIDKYQIEYSGITGELYQQNWYSGI